jgi:hypothetical protein
MYLHKYMAECMIQALLLHLETNVLRQKVERGLTDQFNIG